MATKLLVFIALCVCTHAVPETPPEYRNTIFGDEKLEGEIFEHYDRSADVRDVVTYNEEAEYYRLPNTTIPTYYNIFWSVNFNDFTFGGTVQINIQSTQDGVSEIVLHSEDLTIASVILTQAGVVIPQNFVFEEDRQFLIVNLTSGTLAYNASNPTTYVLTINFGADMRNDMYGIYRSWFKNNYTETASWMATTQFQATSARKAFPCYDEPSFKATFDITIRRPTTHRSWSCTRISQTNPTIIVGYEDDVYLTTPIMSTYLLALIVADYDTLPLYDTNGTLLYEVIAREAAISSGQGDYAFDVGQQLLGNMSEHTDIDFFSVDSALKMTQAAIPDFSAGAMENWGLLTYREAYVLYDSENTNSYFKQLIAYILSHEIAHMWFGNLVTCKWWDVLWLNEGFARYYQYFLTYWVEDMGLDTRFITEQIHTSLLSDSVQNAHPLNNPGVGSPAEVSAMFSTLSYNKGAAVIRMTEHLLGFEVHREGLRQYLRDFAFDVAEPIDLFESLQNAAVSAGAISEYGSDFSVIDYYKTWTDLAGHPVLLVQVNHQTGDMTILQRRFDINYGFSHINTNYIIPITFSTESNPDHNNTKPTHIIDRAVTVINRGSVGDEWVVFNKQQTGFYRVNYDDYTWNLIVIALRGANRTLIHEYNRAQIVNDVFQFARSGIMSYTRAFTILSFLRNETSYAPWVAAMTGFTWLRNRFAGTPHLAGLEELIVEWGGNVMADIGYTEDVGEDFMRSYLRYQLAPVMCALNVPACREEASRQFQALVVNGTEVPVDSRNWVYCNGLRDGSTSDYDFLWERFERHNVYTEKILILMTIGCTPHEEKIIEFMDAITEDNELVRPQDYDTALNTAVAGNENNTQIVFRYIQENFTKFQNAWAPPKNIVSGLSYVSSRLRTDEEVDAYIAWASTVQNLTTAQYDSVVSNAASTRQSFRWTESVTEDVTNYLVNGDLTIETSTPAPTTPVPDVTESQPELSVPETPDFGDSAVSTFLSISVLIFAFIANVLL